eukprot:4115910-Pleurochrysis_carterae.AAC.1
MERTAVALKRSAPCYAIRQVGHLICYARLGYAAHATPRLCCLCCAPCRACAARERAHSPKRGFTALYCATPRFPSATETLSPTLRSILLALVVLIRALQKSFPPFKQS